MLSHQLPALPPFVTFWDELPIFFEWLHDVASPRIPAAYIGDEGEEAIRERTLRLPVSVVTQAYIEIIRFAASNLLCVDMDYERYTRRIEPYSLRRTEEGNIVLNAYDVDKNEHHNYLINGIHGARVAGQVFSPRFAVELTPSAQSLFR